ncbi:MAG: hypothetical protein M3R58_05250 [Pseudomonadota bacterium]|nr:hypothetical protein [Pseudomonadota bacterium]
MTKDFLRMASGAIVWAAHFTVLYGFTALACTRGFSGAIPWVTGAATLTALGAASVIVATSFPARAHFTAWMTAAIAGLASVAIVFEGLAIVMVPACR